MKIGVDFEILAANKVSGIHHESTPIPACWVLPEADKIGDISNLVPQNWMVEGKWSSKSVGPKESGNLPTWSLRRNLKKRATWGLPQANWAIRHFEMHQGATIKRLGSHCAMAPWLYHGRSGWVPTSPTNKGSAQWGLTKVPIALQEVQDALWQPWHGCLKMWCIWMDRHEQWGKWWSTNGFLLDIFKPKKNTCVHDPSQ